MYALGIDPGFASFGWAIVEIGPDWLELVKLGVIRTKKSAKKLKMLATDDNHRRTRLLWEELTCVLDSCERAGTPVQIAATEAQSWPRNASVSAKVGLAWGMFNAALFERDIPLVQATPQQIKKALTDNRSASKAKVREALAEFEGMGSLEDHLSEIRATTQHEHPVDAAAAVVACLDHPAIELGRKL